MSRQSIAMESAVQRTVCEHLDRRGASDMVWFHVPNGGRRDKKTAAILSGQGVKSGVSDLILLHKGKAYALELKSDKGRTIANQKQFLIDFERAGGFGFVAQGLDEALTILETEGLLKGRAQ